MARSALMTVMIQAAFKAGKSLTRDFGEVENLQVSVKGPGDFVSQADKKAEKILHTELSRARPGYSFLMEEEGEVTGDDPQHRWIIDPLDGTTNFLHGIPLFAISIALERQGQIVAGLVFNPVMDELFTAERGNGAFVNDRRLRVAGRRDMFEAVIGTGVPHIGRGDHGKYLKQLAKMMPEVAGKKGSTHGMSPPAQSSSAKPAAILPMKPATTMWSMPGQLSLETSSSTAIY
jgi:myo-inositol-1(or 4)-monophosphatase